MPQIGTGQNIILEAPSVSTGGGGGSGTVTSVAVVTANGVSGSVANPTTAAAITLTLGNITPSHVNGNVITTGTGTLTLGAGKTLTVSNTLTLTGTDASSVAFGTGGTVAYTANNLGVFAATTSAQLAGVISDETGTGALVFATSPVFTTPNIGSATGDISGNAGTVTTNANLTGVITSVGNATSIASQTGTGTKFVVDTSPTLVTPALGVATATSINKMAITAPLTGSTLAVADGKTLTVSNTLTFTGTDASSVAFGAGGTATFTSDNLGVFAATTSAQLAGVISDETGSGALVFANTPTLVTPVLGAATATSINGVTLTASTGVLTITNGKTLAVTQSLTFAGTDSTTMTFPTTSATIARTDAANVFTGQQTLATASVFNSAVANDNSTNFFKLTGTMPTTPTAAVEGINVQIAGAGSASQIQLAGLFQQTAGYGGNKRTGWQFQNDSAGTGSSITSSTGNLGLGGIASGTSAALTIGLCGRGGSAGGTLGIGVVGLAASIGTPTSGAGGVFYTVAGTNRIGVYGGLDTSDPTLTLTAAAVFNNAAVAAPILLAKDNGTTVFSVDDASSTLTTATMAAVTGAATTQWGMIEELLTLNTGATTTATSTNLAPANSRLRAILVFVKVTITTAATYTIGVTGGNIWKDYAGGSTTLSNLTAGQGYVLWPNAFGDDLNAAATTLTVTTNANPGAGQLRLVTVYEQYTTSTS